MADDTVVDLGALRIRRKRLADFPDDYAWRIDPELARYDGATPIDVAYEQFAARMEHELRFGDPSRCSFSIETAEGTHIGNIMYYNAPASRDAAELGMSVALPAYRGQGLGTAVMVGFLRYLWASTSFRVLALRTLDWNAAAIAAFRRAGFSETGLETSAAPRMVGMAARREWWLLWDSEGRFEAALARARDWRPAAGASAPISPGPSAAPR